MDTDHKYMTFKSSDAIAVTDGYVTFKTDARLEDAVVIRRQDLFASPALASYAASITIALKFLKDVNMRREMMRVADYFQRQSELAADEGFKLPTI